MWSDIWNGSYIELRIWNQLSYDHCTGSNPVEARCDDHSSLERFEIRSSIYETSHMSLQILNFVEQTESDMCLSLVQLVRIYWEIVERIDVFPSFKPWAALAFAYCQVFLFNNMLARGLLLRHQSMEWSIEVILPPKKSRKINVISP